MRECESKRMHILVLGEFTPAGWSTVFIEFELHSCDNASASWMKGILNTRLSGRGKTCTRWRVTTCMRLIGAIENV